MSKETVSAILVKAITSKDYRDQLFTNPEAAFVGYDLTEEEMNALKKIDRATFDAAATELESRMLKAGQDLNSIDAVMIQCDAIDGGNFVEALDLSNLFGK